MKKTRPIKKKLAVAKKYRARGGATFLCPKCRSPTRVLRTMRLVGTNVVSRDRICPNNHRHQTTESHSAKLS